MGGNIYIYIYNTHWPQITAPFYSILFETSICQFNSSKVSPIMPDEVREHLTRDQRPFLHPESLQILQIHSSMTVLLLFSSPHSFSTGFRSEDWNGQSRSLVLCPVTHFCVVFEDFVWIIVQLEDPNMAHYKISNRVSHLLIFYLLVFDRIHDAMYLNKMSRTSSRNIGPQHKKYSSIFHCTHGVLFYPCVQQNPSWVFAAKKLIFLFYLTIEASPIWSYSCVWQLNMLEIFFLWVRRVFLETLPNNMWWCRGCLTFCF